MKKVIDSENLKEAVRLVVDKGLKEKEGSRWFISFEGESVLHNKRIDGNKISGKVEIYYVKDREKDIEYEAFVRSKKPRSYYIERKERVK